jgi:hypothetical protein
LSDRIAGRQAQARQDELAVLGVAELRDALDDERGNGAQASVPQTLFGANDLYITMHDLVELHAALPSDWICYLKAAFSSGVDALVGGHQTRF